MEQIGHQEQATRDIKEIGAILRDKWNMKPAAIMEKNVLTGLMETKYTPPPVYSDLNLRDMGKQTLSI